MKIAVTSSGSTKESDMRVAEGAFGLVQDMCAGHVVAHRRTRGNDRLQDDVELHQKHA
jgi:hypothetical protein